MPFVESDLVRRFDRVGNDPKFWIRKARALLGASATLLEAYDHVCSTDPPGDHEAFYYDDPGLMLRGMGFECLLKALALARKTVLAKGGRYITPPGVKSHDLVGLAKFVRVRLSGPEEEALRALSRYIVAGRYPIQNRWSEQTRLHSDGKVEFLPTWPFAWDELSARLAKRIVARLPPTMHDGLDTFGRPLPPALKPSSPARKAVVTKGSSHVRLSMRLHRTRVKGKPLTS